MRVSRGLGLEPQAAAAAAAEERRHRGRRAARERPDRRASPSAKGTTRKRVFGSVGASFFVDFFRLCRDLLLTCGPLVCSSEVTSGRRLARPRRARRSGHAAQRDTMVLARARRARGGTSRASPPVRDAPTTWTLLAFLLAFPSPARAQFGPFGSEGSGAATCDIDISTIRLDPTLGEMCDPAKQGDGLCDACICDMADRILEAGYAVTGPEAISFETCAFEHLATLQRQGGITLTGMMTVASRCTDMPACIPELEARYGMAGDAAATESVAAAPAGSSGLAGPASGDPDVAADGAAVDPEDAPEGSKAQELLAAVADVRGTSAATAAPAPGDPVPGPLQSPPGPRSKPGARTSPPPLRRPRRRRWSWAPRRGICSASGGARPWRTRTPTSSRRARARAPRGWSSGCDLRDDAGAAVPAAGETDAIGVVPETPRGRARPRRPTDRVSTQGEPRGSLRASGPKVSARPRLRLVRARGDARHHGAVGRGQEHAAGRPGRPNRPARHRAWPASAAR